MKLYNQKIKLSAIAIVKIAALSATFTFKNCISKKLNCLQLPLILILLNLGFISKLHSQTTWPQPTATWVYCLTDWQGIPAGKEIFKVIGDTTISENTYSIIAPINSGIKNRKLFTRYSNDTVYRYVNGQEYLYFTFNLKIGDIFTTFRTAGWNNHWGDSACTSVLPLKVIEKSEIELNGQALKKIVLEDTLFKHLYNPNYPNPVTYTLIERIGVINTYHFINTIEPPKSCSLPSDWGLAEIGAYYDNNFEYIFKDCKGDKFESNDTYNDVIISPNPAKNFVEIIKTPNALSKYNIKLLNNIGQVVLTTEIWAEKHTIDVSNVCAGYYILVLSPDNNYKSKSSFPIIIKH